MYAHSVTRTAADRVTILGPAGPRYDEILTPEALAFVVRLDGVFAARRAELLDARRRRRSVLIGGGKLGFLPETAAIRQDPTWRVAPVAPGLADRRAEITGPPDLKMAVNALNSGAKVWMADFEDATSPTWSNVVDGQIVLYDAIRRRIDHTTPQGKRYAVGENPATILVRPRGWHLVDKHFLVDGRPVSGSLLDFGLYFFHNAKELIDRGAGPYFYLPKLESHREAKLWNDVFTVAQKLLGIPHGTIRATVLIETILAAYEMEEILYELRDHSAGLNAGRWDYIFSVIKNFAARPDFVLPDRASVTMTVPFMRAYTELLVSTCHRRGAHAIGGMAAFIPSRRDAEVNAAALAKVRADKEREAGDGFDGSWVAHPDLVPTCTEVFTEVLGDRPNQLDRLRDDVVPDAAALLSVPETGGDVTLAGVRGNVRVALRYITAWLGGAGAVGIDNLMEDAATAEIARCQVWQWIRHGVVTVDGPIVTRDLVNLLVAEESAAMRAELRTAPEAELARVQAAVDIFTEIALTPVLPEFFTTGAYAHRLTTTTAPATQPPVNPPPVLQSAGV